MKTKRARKTIKVQEVKDRLNDFLANSSKELISERKGVISSLEIILFDSGNYSGYKFLTKNEVKDGFPGIRENNGFIDVDCTRRFYF